jgi:UDP-glucose 4-epimerase
MRVLVTGGAGFIGSHLVEELLQRGDSVRVLDDFSTGRRENLSPWQNDLEIIEADLRDEARVTQAVKGVEWVFHLAAFVSVPQSMLKPETCFAVNVGGTVGLLEASRKAGVRKVILSSSTAVYGDTDVLPTPEDTPLHPLSPYAVSKQVNELYARLYTRVFNLPVIALRYFNIYGPRQRPDSPYAAVIPIFVNLLANRNPLTVYGDGKQSRDFVYVKDVVRANLLAAVSEAAGEVCNICSGQETTLLDLLEEMSELSQVQPKVHFEAPRSGDILRSVGSPEKSRRMIGFQAQTSLADGLAQTMQWMQTK